MKSESYGLGFDLLHVALSQRLNLGENEIPNLLPLVNGPDLDLAAVLQLDHHVAPDAQASADRNNVLNVLHGALELLLVFVPNGRSVCDRDALVRYFVIHPRKTSYGSDGEGLLGVK